MSELWLAISYWLSFLQVLTLSDFFSKTQFSIYWPRYATIHQIDYSNRSMSSTSYHQLCKVILDAGCNNLVLNLKVLLVFMDLNDGRKASAGIDKGMEASLL